MTHRVDDFVAEVDATIKAQLDAAIYRNLETGTDGHDCDDEECDCGRWEDWIDEYTFTGSVPALVTIGQDGKIEQIATIGQHALGGRKAWWARLLRYQINKLGHVVATPVRGNQAMLVWTDELSGSST